MRDLFKGAQYNSKAGAKCAVYSRARTKQGRGVIKEIRPLHNLYKYISLKILWFKNDTLSQVYFSFKHTKTILWEANSY